MAHTCNSNIREIRDRTDKCSTTYPHPQLNCCSLHLFVLVCSRSFLESDIWPNFEEAARRVGGGAEW